MAAHYDVVFRVAGRHQDQGVCPRQVHGGRDIKVQGPPTSDRGPARRHDIYVVRAQVGDDAGPKLATGTGDKDHEDSNRGSLQ